MFPPEGAVLVGLALIALIVYGERRADQRRRGG